MRTSISHVLMVIVTASIVSLSGGLAFAKNAPPDFVELSKKLTPSVVNISTSKTVNQQQQFNQPQTNPFGSNPFGDFERFFRGFPSAPAQAKKPRVRFHHQ